MGRYFEGVADDVYRFQELDSDDEKNGVSLDPNAQRASTTRHLNPSDELYFNDMDIGAWERRASALGGPPYAPDYDFQEEDEGYFDDAGDPVSAAEYEELLFQRVLDKIRVARAAGNPDVQLSAEEIEAYHSKLHGDRTPAARPQPRNRPTSGSLPNDSASITSAIENQQAGHASSSRSKPKKSQQRSSLFSSKPKKEKPSSRKRAPSTVSSVGSHNSPGISPGFVVPGPDGQPMYTPINAYQGNLARDSDPSYRPAPRPASGSYPAPAATAIPRNQSSRQAPRDVPGAFPGTFIPPAHPYQPESPARQDRIIYPEPQQEQEDHIRSSSGQSAKLVPFPVEQYQYHNFNASDSSSSQTSPQLQYVRRPSAPPSEASYTSMPRRVPVPTQHTAPVASSYDNYSDPTLTQSMNMQPEAATGNASVTIEVLPQPTAVQLDRGGGNGRDGERKRKGGKKKKV